MLGPVDASAPLPPGHPETPRDPPSQEENTDHEEEPLGIKIPQDSAVEDSKIAPGRVEVQVVDPKGEPLPKKDVTLGINSNSVAKGEKRTRVTALTNDRGVATFDDLDVGQGVSFRATVINDGAAFSAPPFQMPKESGVRVLLHVYPLFSDIEQGLVVTQAIVYAEIKDDRLQVEQIFNIYNFGRTAWVPKDLVIPLPQGYTAFSAQQSTTNIGVEEVPKKGAKLRGTFSPGEHSLEFRWQEPYSGESEMKFEAAMTPHLAACRILAPAFHKMEMEVFGFPPSETVMDRAGQRLLVTERQFRREEPPFTRARIELKGIPTEGPGKIIATLLAACGVGLGLAFSARRRSPHPLIQERAYILDELEALERGHLAGDIGPKTYERARRELMDDLARMFEKSQHK